MVPQPENIVRLLIRNIGKRDPWFPRVIPYDPIAQGLPDPLAKPTPAVAPLQCVPGLYLNGTSCLPCPSGFTSTVLVFSLSLSLSLSLSPFFLFFSFLFLF